MKIFTFYLLTLISIRSYSQTLSIQETINYINKSFYDDANGKYYDEINLTNEGVFTVHNTYTKWTYKMEISEVKLGNMNDNRFQIKCKSPEKTPGSLDYFVGEAYTAPNCIQVNGRPTGSDNPTQWFSLWLKDLYNNKKLYNAFNYLFALIEADGSYKRKDDDPFASNNYNPKAIDIKGNSKSSVIKLEKGNGVYYILVTVGSIKKKFVLDTGASDVLLSESAERDLINLGVINKGNYITPALYKIADGSIVQCRRLVLPELKIGNFTITNVTASVGVGTVPLLLGKSFLDKFKKWTIDNLSETLNLEK